MVLHSATGHTVTPTGEGSLYFQLHNKDGNQISINTQHIPEISSSILSPGEVLETLDYESYSLTCNCKTGESLLVFQKPDSPSYDLKGHYQGRLAYLPHVPRGQVDKIVGSLSFTPDPDMPIHHDLQTTICQITHSAIQMGIPEHCIHPSYVRNTIFLLTIEKAAQEYMMTVPGVPFQTPICYLSEHMQRLLWHFLTGHPNSDRLLKLQKMSKGIPRLK